MTTTNKRKEYIAARKANHIKELQTLGYTKTKMNALTAIENRVNFAATQYANGDITDIAYKNIEVRAYDQITILFGGTLPKGFFINSDPRGYALKLDDDVYRQDTPQDQWPISYKDFGGYMILAPDFNY